MCLVIPLQVEELLPGGCARLSDGRVVSLCLLEESVFVGDRVVSKGCFAIEKLTSGDVEELERILGKLPEIA